MPGSQDTDDCLILSDTVSPWGQVFPGFGTKSASEELVATRMSYRHGRNNFRPRREVKHPAQLAAPESFCSTDGLRSLSLYTLELRKPLVFAVSTSEMYNRVCKQYALRLALGGQPIRLAKDVVFQLLCCTVPTHFL